jgi:hypothetical protein
MTKWAFQPGMMPYMEDPLSNAAPLDPAVLSLQVKVMHKPTFYEVRITNPLLFTFSDANESVEYEFPFSGIFSRKLSSLLRSITQNYPFHIQRTCPVDYKVYYSILLLWLN